MSRARKEKPVPRPIRVPRQARARATFDSILDAAEQLLGEHGYAALTTNHVADTAGVGIGSVYEYFGDKDAIVAEVARRVVSRILEEIAAAHVATDASDPHAALRDWIHAMFVAVGSRKDIVRVLSREVPFLWDLDELRELAPRMLAIAHAARRADVPLAAGANLEAATFLLTVMVSQAVIATSIERPPHLAEEAIEATLVAMIGALVLPPASRAIVP